MEKGYIKKCAMGNSYSYLKINSEDVIGVDPIFIVRIYNALLKQNNENLDHVQKLYKEKNDLRQEKMKSESRARGIQIEMQEQIEALKKSLQKANEQIDLMKKEREAMRTEIIDCRHSLQPMAY